MSSLSTQSYKGSRDYFPEEKRLQNYILMFGTRRLRVLAMKNTARRYWSR